MICSLIGMKHVGKSTLLKQLEPHGVCFDLDQQILLHSSKDLQQQHSSIRELYRELGKALFRKLEYTVLRTLLKDNSKPSKGDFVFIATGGGLAETARAMRLLRRQSIIVQLYCDFETIWERVSSTGIPAFVHGNPKEELLTLFEKRSRVYRRYAHHTLDARQATEAQVKQLLSFLA